MAQRGRHYPPGDRGREMRSQILLFVRDLQVLQRERALDQITNAQMRAVVIRTIDQLTDELGTGPIPYYTRAFVTRLVGVQSIVCHG